MDKNFQKIDLRLKKNWLCTDSPDLFLRLTANEFWELVASSYGMTLDEVESRLAYLLELFDFEGHRYEVIPSHMGCVKKYLLLGHCCRSRYLGTR